MNTTESQTNRNLPTTVTPAHVIPAIPTQVAYDKSNMDYKVEWLVTQEILPEYLALRYWKNQVVDISDREELIFFRQEELRNHATEIDNWSISGGV